MFPLKSEGHARFVGTVRETEPRRENLSWHENLVWNDVSKRVIEWMSIDVERVNRAKRKMPLHAFAWRPEMDRAGLRHDAVYLVRPDGYVAMTASERGAAAVAAYLDTRKLAALSAGSPR